MDTADVWLTGKRTPTVIDLRRKPAKMKRRRRDRSEREKVAPFSADCRSDNRIDLRQTSRSDNREDDRPIRQGEIPEEEDEEEEEADEEESEYETDSEEADEEESEYETDSEEAMVMPLFGPEKVMQSTLIAGDHCYSIVNEDPK